jgi:hypothetical protein
MMESNQVDGASSLSQTPPPPPPLPHAPPLPPLPSSLLTGTSRIVQPLPPHSPH